MHLMKIAAVAPKVLATGTEVTETVVENVTSLSNVVTADMLGGVLDEVVALLPVCIPVMIGFMALRKGISFLQGILRSA